jgi:hypothetical protein
VVSERLRERVAMLHPVCDAYNEGKLLEFYAEPEQLERDPAFDFVQPNELEAIRKERPDGSRRLAMRLTDDELRDRLQRGDHRPDCWGGGRRAAPLNDTIRPLVFGFQQVTMTELAERTLAVHRRVAAAGSG